MFELAMYARNYSFEGLKILDVEIRDKTYFGGETFGGRFTLVNLMYERQEDNFGKVRDRLLGSSGHD
ncbi:unnamed protein product [Brassica oleracea]|uniref:Uncharacterized protein n=1 Tax=Brassica oleracea TaxID=3712 RepID=A0A3P6GL45_BRAOL|nr:unnamed protein product [Brassica oleracea]